MMNGYSVDQIRHAEEPHRAAGEPLMLRAAAGLAAEIRTLMGAAAEGELRAVVLLVGSGDNGGDALYAGAELAAEGTMVAIVPTGSRMHEKALEAARDAGARIHWSDPLDAGLLTRLALSSDVIVDGILGTGTSSNPTLRGRAREVVDIIRPAVLGAAAPAVVAVDIPSGINPDTGAVPDSGILRADLTVTFGGCKAGLLLEPATKFAGRVHLVDIGIGDDLALLTPVIDGTNS